MKYDVSIIMPFFHKFEELSISLKSNHKQFSLVNEVIIIIDHFIEDLSLFSYLYDYKNINFIFLMNKENHPWRNPGIVINKGIMESKSKYCIVLSPETILLDNTIKHLISNTDEYSFSIGQIIFLHEKSKVNLEEIFKNKKERNEKFIGPDYFGTICCSRENFIKAGLYSIYFKDWGGRR
jgi:hypothetical protein